MAPQRAPTKRQHARAESASHGGQEHEPPEDNLTFKVLNLIEYMKDIVTNDNRASIHRPFFKTVLGKGKPIPDNVLFSHGRLVQKLDSAQEAVRESK
jgi:hypothetical protein